MDTSIFNTPLEHGDKKRIATLADVSISTVSRAINGGKVKTEYMVKVLKAYTTLLKERNQQLKQVEKLADQVANSAS